MSTTPINKQDFTNKVVVVLDSTNILGDSLIKYLHESGAHVLFLKTNTLNLNELSICKYSEDETHVLGSFQANDDTSINKCLEIVNNNFGKIDIFINNLEMNIGKGILEITPEEWNEGLNINLHLPFILLQSFTPLLEKSSNGKIINVSAPNAINGKRGAVSYAASKSALESLNKALSRELGPKGINVNAISFDSTDFSDDNIEQYIPLHRRATTTDITSSILFLASSMSNYMSGQVMLVDGGRTIL